jgi:hypothetical protein
MTFVDPAPVPRTLKAVTFVGPEPFSLCAGGAWLAVSLHPTYYRPTAQAPLHTQATFQVRSLENVPLLKRLNTVYTLFL